MFITHGECVVDIRLSTDGFSIVVLGDSRGFEPEGSAWYAEVCRMRKSQGLTHYRPLFAMTAVAHGPIIASIAPDFNRIVSDGNVFCFDPNSEELAPAEVAVTNYLLSFDREHNLGLISILGGMECVSFKYQTTFVNGLRPTVFRWKNSKTQWNS